MTYDAYGTNGRAAAAYPARFERLAPQPGGPQHGLAPSQVEIDHTHALYSSGFDGLLQLDEGTCGQPLASSEYGQPPQRRKMARAGAECVPD